MIRQISIFAENTKGAMQNLTAALAGAEIDIETMVTNDSAEFGIIRMIVSDAELAKKVLSEAGYLVHIDDVISVDLNDTPGGLNTLLLDIKKSNVNLDYIYISYDRKTAIPQAIIKSQDLADFEECLKGYGHRLR